MTTTRTPLAAALTTTLTLLAAAAPAAAGGTAISTLSAAEPLTLRVGDAIAAPGGLAAVVIRTYSSRPVGQGQLDFYSSRRLAAPPAGLAIVPQQDLAGGEPLAPYLTGHLVFSGNGDAQSFVDRPKEAPDALRLLFASPTGSVNDLDGPLAVLFFRLPRELAPGTVFDVSLGAGETFLIDRDGEPVPVEIEPGTLTVRAFDAPRLLVADGDRIEPGEPAELGVETLEPFALAAGRIVLHYDPAIAAGPPAVRFDRRYGRASFTADVSIPGTIVVDFQAVEGSLNRIPGAFVQVALPTDPALPPGTRSPLELDRGRTWLQPFGLVGELPLTLADAEIEVEPD